MENNILYTCPPYAPAMYDGDDEQMKQWRDELAEEMAVLYYQLIYVCKDMPLEQVPCDVVPFVLKYKAEQEENKNGGK